MCYKKAYTILNADGDEADRSVKTCILQRAGYQVVEAVNGTDALRLVLEAQPQLVVLDAGLPDLSAVEVCRSIKTAPATTRIMVLQISAAGVTRGC